MRVRHECAQKSKRESEGESDGVHSFLFVKDDQHR